MEKRCHKHIISKESYLTPLKQGDHVVYVSEKRAHDALVLKLRKDRTADLTYVEVNEERRSYGSRVVECVEYKEKHEPPYWWIPDMLDNHRWTTPGKEL